MTAENTPPNGRGVGDAARREFLEQLFWKTADAMLAAISVEKPSAGALQAVRAWLRDQGVTLSTLIELRRAHGGLGFDPRDLPSFREDDGDQLAELAEPLKKVQPFAPTTSTTPNNSDPKT